MQIILVMLALLPAVLFSQAPEFVQQYRQRLGGAADELGIVVRNFDEDSQRSGYTREGALELMGRNPERLIREQGQRMIGYMLRLERLRRQQVALGGAAVTVNSMISVARDYDEPLMRQTWRDYTAAVPTTPTGLISAMVGWLLGYLLLIAVIAPFRIRRRVSGSVTRVQR